MYYIVVGMKYGLIATGWLLTFVGGALVVISLCAFFGWIVSRFFER